MIVLLDRPKGHTVKTLDRLGLVLVGTNLVLIWEGALTCCPLEPFYRSGAGVDQSGFG